MKGYRFDPSRLARPPKQQKRQGYAMAARLLREYLGGTPPVVPVTTPLVCTEPRARSVLEVSVPVERLPPDI